MVTASTASTSSTPPASTGSSAAADKTIVVLGGNGYVGKVLVKQWLKRDANTRFLLISRSGDNPFNSARVSAAKADATNPASLEAVLPAHVDCMVCLVGGMDSAEQNIAPVKAMIAVANERNIPRLGYVGGTLGGKVFKQSKAEACNLLRNSGKQVTIVEPTLIYGAGRNDSLSKMVPLLKVFGLFAKGLRPVRVESVASQLIDGLDK